MRLPTFVHVFLPITSVLSFTFTPETIRQQSSVVASPTFPYYVPYQHSNRLDKIFSLQSTSKATTDTIESSDLIVPPIADLGGTPSSGGFDVDEATKDLLADKLNDVAFKGAMPVCVAWSRTNSGTGAQIVERILYNVAKEIVDGNEAAKSVAFLNLCTVAIDAWATSGEKGAAEKAEALLGGMKHVAETTEDESLMPSTISYNAVLKAYARQAASGDNEAGKNAERILDMMEQASIKRSSEDEGDECELGSPIEPNQITYTTVIDCYAKSKSKKGAQNAERIFRRMESQYENGCTSARPSVQSFNVVIDAYVKSGLVRGPQAAQEILEKMIYLHEKGVEDVEPSTVTFSSVMNGWAKSKQSGSAERALEVFEMMESLREKKSITATANAYTYSILIDALCKGGMLKEAENVFNNIVKDYAEDQTKPVPSVIQLTQIINGIAKSGDGNAGVRAEVLLTTLDRLYEKYQDEAMRPSAYTYTSVINSWAKSKSFDKARKARETLDRMKEAYLKGNESAKPNVNAVTAVLNACAFTQGEIPEKMEALKIASSTYKDLVTGDYDSPNQYTFATFMRVCSNIIPVGEQRVSSMESVLRQAANNGLVDNLVLKVLKTALTKEELESILPCNVTDNLCANDLPAEWTKNIQSSIRPKRSKRR